VQLCRSKTLQGPSFYGKKWCGVYWLLIPKSGRRIHHTALLWQWPLKWITFTVYFSLSSVCTDSGWSICPYICRVCTTRLTGAAGLPPGWTSWGSELGTAETLCWHDCEDRGERWSSEEGFASAAKHAILRCVLWVWLTSGQ